MIFELLVSNLLHLIDHIVVEKVDLVNRHIGERNLILSLVKIIKGEDALVVVARLPFLHRLLLPCQNWLLNLVFVVLLDVYLQGFAELGRLLKCFLPVAFAEEETLTIVQRLVEEA